MFKRWGFITKLNTRPLKQINNQYLLFPDLYSINTLNFVYRTLLILQELYPHKQVNQVQIDYCMVNLNALNEENNYSGLNDFYMNNKLEAIS